MSGRWCYEAGAGFDGAGGYGFGPVRGVDALLPCFLAVVAFFDVVVVSPSLRSWLRQLVFRCSEVELH